ncbi:alpha/beta hydrolase fold domain-containing protein [Trichoderma sp. SZMC 28014]
MDGPMSPAVEGAIASPSTPSHTAQLRSNLKLLFMLLPKIPLLTQVAILHVLRLSEPPKYIDLQTNLVVSLIRSLMTPSTPQSVSSIQRLTKGSNEVKGKTWVSTYASPPPPETDIRDSLIKVVESMGGLGLKEGNVRIPPFVYVEGEWTGYRASASKKEPLPNISEVAKYHELMKECQKPTTVLYFHGGAYYFCDPATHRDTVAKLAELTKGRCYSVRYRLAPQNPFPSALLDALVSYFTLLYPPPDAFHEAVKPEHIAVAGDSAGGNLSLALLQLLLQLRRTNARIQWYGEQREVPLPAGIACVSPWVDITHSTPPWQLSHDPYLFDYLPKPRPELLAKIPRCPIWPASPPRKRFYVDDHLAAHPLVTLIMNDSWEGSPPIWMITGWELLDYEDKALAMKLAADGVPLVFEEYEAMSHCFALFLQHLPSSQRCLENWAGFISRAVENPASIGPRATTIKARTLEEIPLKFETLLDVSLEDIQAAVVSEAEGAEQPGIAARL